MREQDCGGGTGAAWVRDRAVAGPSGRDSSEARMVVWQLTIYRLTSRKPTTLVECQVQPQLSVQQGIVRARRR